MFVVKITQPRIGGQKMSTNELLAKYLREKNIKISRLSKKVGFDLFKVIYGKRKISFDEMKKVCAEAGLDLQNFLNNNA